MTDIPEIGVGAVYGHGWRQLWKHFGILLGVTVVMMLLGVVPGAAPESAAANYGLLAMAYQVLVIGPVTYGGYYVFLRAARDDAPAFTDLFAAFGNYWNAALASFAVSLIIGLGLIFLIVPGVIFACKLIFVPYLVVERRMRAFDAMNESWRMTDGCAWTAFGILLLAIPIAMAGILLLGVGVIVSIMWIGLAVATLYMSVSEAGDTASLTMPG